MGLSLGFGKEKSKSSNKTDNTIDAWTKGLFEPAFNQASGLLGGSATAYGGQLGAQDNPLQTQARSLAQGNVGAGQSTLQGAISGAQGMAGYTPQNVNAGQFSREGLSKYFDPYQQDVIDAATGDINRGRQQQINADSGAFSRAGAWGGSRQGVADSLTNEAALRQIGSTAAGLRSQGWNTAAGLMGQDQNRQMQADLANQGAGLQGANLNQQTLGLLGQFAGQQQQMGANDAGLVAGLGQQQFANETANNDAQYQEFLRMYQDPFMRSQGLAGLLGAIPKIVDSKGSGKQSGSSMSAGWSAT
jgi:hypothetical protein